MKKLTEEQKNDDLVKSLLGSGFSEEVIAGWVENGAITLEKSVDSEDGDKKDPDEEDPDKEGKKDEELEKGCGKENKEDELHKGISSEIMKSFEDALSEKFKDANEEIMKSLPTVVEGIISPLVSRIEKSIDGMRQAIVAFGNQAPTFKSAGLSKAVIEKSIELGGGAKDEDNKTVLSVSRDRAVVRELIAKSIEEEADPEIQKSLKDNTTAYLLDPICGEIGKEAALYMYNKKNVRLVK